MQYLCYIKRVKRSLVFLENKNHQMNSLSKNAIINLKTNKKHTHTKTPQTSILFTFSSPLCLDEGTGVEICWRLSPVQGTRYQGVCRDLPGTGHSQFQPALIQPKQQWKNPTWRQREAALLESIEERHRPPLRAGDTLFEGGSSLAQHSPAEGEAGCGRGRLTPGQGHPEGLQPWTTGKAVTHKAAETVTQNGLNLLLPQSAPRVNVAGLRVTCSENTHSVFFLPRKGKGMYLCTCILFLTNKMSDRKLVFKSN